MKRKHDKRGEKYMGLKGRTVSGNTLEILIMDKLYQTDAGERIKRRKQMFETKFNAQHWKTNRDHEDEVSVWFKIPMSDSKNALGIPNNKNLIISVKEGYLDENGNETEE